MKVIFEEWSCPNISKNEMEGIENIIKLDLVKDKENMKHIPPKLTVSLSYDPLEHILKGIGISESGETLVRFTCAITRGHDREYDYLHITGKNN